MTGEPLLTEGESSAIPLNMGVPSASVTSDVSEGVEDVEIIIPEPPDEGVLNAITSDEDRKSVV